MRRDTAITLAICPQLRVKKGAILGTVVAAIALLCVAAVIALWSGRAGLPPLTFTLQAPYAGGYANPASHRGIVARDDVLFAMTAPLYRVIDIEVPTIVALGAVKFRPCDPAENTCDFDAGPALIANGGDTGGDGFDAAAAEGSWSPAPFGEPGFTDTELGIDDHARCGGDPDALVADAEFAAVAWCLPQYIPGASIFLSQAGPSRPDAVPPNPLEVTNSSNPIPEPTSVVLFGGALLLGWHSRRRG